MASDQYQQPNAQMKLNQKNGVKNAAMTPPNTNTTARTISPSATRNTQRFGR